MPNAIEKLFDSVLARFPPESAEIEDEPKAENAESRDIIDEPLDSESDKVHTLDFHDSVYDAHDALQSGRTPWQLSQEDEDISKVVFAGPGLTYSPFTSRAGTSRHDPFRDSGEFSTCDRGCCMSRQKSCRLTLGLGNHVTWRDNSCACTSIFTIGRTCRR